MRSSKIFSYIISAKDNPSEYSGLLIQFIINCLNIPVISANCILAPNVSYRG